MTNDLQSGYKNLIFASLPPVFWGGFFAIWWRSGCTYQQIAFHRRKMKANMRLRLGMLQRFVKLMLHKLFGEMWCVFFVCLFFVAFLGTMERC